MDLARSFLHRYGSKYSGYTQPGNPSSTHVANAFDRDENSNLSGHDALNTRPIISLNTDSTYNASINFFGLRRHLMPMLLAFLPSFVYSRNKKPRKIFPTSYLDGLRGVAAFFVVIHHYTMAYTATSGIGYGLERPEDPPGSHNWFWLLPVIRVVHAGRFMVVIFFVISGYVLSHRSLKLARLGKHLELLESLASSVFRRWLRLHLPVAASCFMGFILARLNWFHYMPKRWEHDPTGKTYLDQHPTPFPRPNGTVTHQFIRQ
jgi:hypothetical protein